MAPINTTTTSLLPQIPLASISIRTAASSPPPPSATTFDPSNNGHLLSIIIPTTIISILVVFFLCPFLYFTIQDYRYRHPERNIMRNFSALWAFHSPDPDSDIELTSSLRTSSFRTRRALGLVEGAPSRQRLSRWFAGTAGAGAVGGAGTMVPPRVGVLGREEISPWAESSPRAGNWRNSWESDRTLVGLERPERAFGRAHSGRLNRSRLGRSGSPDGWSVATMVGGRVGDEARESGPGSRRDGRSPRARRFVLGSELAVTSVGWRPQGWRLY